MHEEESKQSKRTKVIIIVIIALVVVSGIVFVATKGSDFKLPSHEQFKQMHGG